MTDIKYDVFQADLPGSPNVNDTIDVDGVESFTPKAAMITCVQPGDDMRYSLGVTDGSTSCFISIRARNNFTTGSGVWRNGDINSVIGRMGIGSDYDNEDQWNFNQWNAGGLQLECGTANANKQTTSGKMLVELFGGADLNAKVVRHNLASGTTTINLGFEFDIIFAFGHCDDLSTNGQFGVGYRGVATWQDSVLSQQCYAFTTAESAGLNIHQRVYDNKIGVQLSTGGGVGHTYNLSNVTATSVDITTSSNTGNDEIVILALKTGDAKVWADVVDSFVNTTDDYDLTAMNFKPLMGGLTGGLTTSVNTGVSTQNLAWSYNAWTNSKGQSIGTRIEDAVSTSNTHSNVYQQALAITDGSSENLLYSADNPTAENTGWKFAGADITAANVTGRKWIAWAIEDTSAGGGITGTTDQTAPSFTQSVTVTYESDSDGTAAQTAASFTQSAAGTFTAAGITGTASQTIPLLSQSAAGEFTNPITGHVNQSLPPLTQTATSEFFEGYTAAARQELPASTQSAVVSFLPPPITGTASQTLPKVTQYAYYQPLISPASTIGLSSIIRCCMGYTGLIDSKGDAGEGDIKEDVVAQSNINTVKTFASVINSNDIGLSGIIKDSIGIIGEIDK